LLVGGSAPLLLAGWWQRPTGWRAFGAMSSSKEKKTTVRDAQQLIEEFVVEVPIF
jgi:hypothetical protein